MMFRIPNLWVFFVTITLCVGFGGVVCAQDELSADPSDLWLRAYMKMRDAETKEESGKDLEALASYRESQRLFDYISRTHPNWKKNMMDFRRRALLDKIDQVHARMKSNGSEDLGPLPGSGIAQSAPSIGNGPMVVRPANPEFQSPGITAPAPPSYTQPPAPMAPNAQNYTQGVNQEFLDLQTQVDLLTGAKQRLERDVAEREQRMQSLQNQLNKAKEVERTMQAQLAKVLGDLKNAETMSEQKVQQTEQQLKLATEELRRANTESASILKALEMAKAEIQEISKERDIYAEERANQMENNAQLSKRLANAITDRDKAREERDQIKKELDEANGKVTEEMIAKFEETERKLHAATQEIKAAKKLAEEATKERDGMAKQLAEAIRKNGELSETNAQLLAELAQSEKTIGELNEKVASLERSNLMMQRENEGLVRERNLLVEQRNQLQQNLDEMAILLDASEQIDGDVKDLVSANLKWQKELAAAKMEIERLTRSGGDYEDELASLRKKVEGIQNERMASEEDSNLYAKKVEELNGKLKTMLTELNTTSQQRDDALQERDVMRAQLDTTVRELDAAKAEITQKDGLLAQAKQRLTSLTEQLTKSQKEVVNLSSSAQENDMLRGLIRKQLVKQARLQQARDIVLDELRKLDVQSVTLLASLDSMAGERLELSEDERAMFKKTEDLQLIEAVESNEAPRALASSSPNAVVMVPAPANTGASVQTTEADLVIAANRENQITQLAKAANYDFSQGNFDSASKGYSKVLHVDRNNLYALCNMGVIYLRQGDLTAAEKFLERALSVDEACADAHYYLGVLNYRNRKLDSSLESFYECLRHGGENANVHNYVGLVASLKGWGTRAETEFKKAVALNPAHSEAYFNLSVLYATRSEPSKPLAKEYYQKALHSGATRDAAMEQFIDS
ncbi:MAG: tetratricopeptide repeat protein [Verrucomicrobiota bacterium]